MRFNSPPGWPTPPPGWRPPPDWKPSPSWPDPPPEWQLWLPDGDDETDSAKPAAAGDADTPDATSPAEAPDSSAAADTHRTRVGSTETAETAALKARIAELEAALEGARTGATDVVELSDQRVLQDVGIYRYHHPLEDAAAYKDRLRELESEIDAVVKSGKAVLAADMFTFGGSLAKGRKMVSDLSRLMLRAYNAEADNCVRSLRAGNVSTAKRRMENAVGPLRTSAR